MKRVDQPPSSTPRSPLRTRALGGLGWSFGSTVASFALQLGHAAIMARLLAPTDFGIIALANAFLRFGGFLSQIGVGHALVQANVLSSSAIRTAHTTTVLLAAALAGIFMLTAPLAGGVTGSPMVVPVIQVLALNLVVTGFGVTSMSLLRRTMRFRALAIIEFGSYALGYVAIGVSLAASGVGVWSLVAAVLCQSMIQSAGAIAIVRHSATPQLDPTELRRLYGFGARFSLVQVIAAVRGAMTNAMVGRFAGIDMLGLFDRAKLIGTLPFEKVETSITKVLFPVMSRAKNDTRLLQRLFTLHGALIATFVLPAMVGLALNSDIVVLILLGEQWTGVAGLLPFITVGVAFGLLSHVARVLADALALLNRRILLDTVLTVVLFVALLVGARAGVVGMAAAVALVHALQYFLYQRLITKHLAVHSVTYVRSILPGIIGSTAVGAVLLTSRLLMSELPLADFITLAVQILFGMIVLAALLRTPLFNDVRGRLAALIGPVADPEASRAASVMRQIVSLAIGVRHQEPHSASTERGA